MIHVSWRIGAVSVAFLWCLVAYPVRATEKLYCFSGVCIGDSPSILNTVSLNNLSNIVVRHPHAVDLSSALPASSEADRQALAKHIDADGRFLIDNQTLSIFLGLGQACVDIAPFAAIFTSESGHLTAVEFGMIKAGTGFRLGVRTITRTFRVAPGSLRYLDLVADLSQKFGFQIDSASPHDAATEVSSSYVTDDKGFQLSFSLPPQSGSVVDAARDGCGSSGRIKID